MIKAIFLGAHGLDISCCPKDVTLYIFPTKKFFEYCFCGKHPVLSLSKITFFVKFSQSSRIS